MEIELIQNVEDIVEKILQQHLEVSVKEKQLINSDICNLLQSLNNDQQYEFSVRLIRAANTKVKEFILFQILKEFAQGNDALQKIEKFLLLQKKFVKSISSIKTVVYQAAQSLQQENIPQFFSYLFDNIFVENLQSTFEQTLFASVIEIIKLASKSDDSKIKVLSELLRNFGDVITQLQKSTEEALQFKIEQTFKQKIYDHYEELYQNYHKEWNEKKSTQIYLEEVAKQKYINEKVLKFNDKTILEQVNKILNSHLLTQYKPQLLGSKNGDNFDSFLIKYHEQPQRYQQVLQLIGDLYGSLEDHYDQLANSFKNLIVKEGQEIMQKKNRQIVDKNEDQNFSDPEFIRSFYKLYEKYYKLITECFSSKSDFIMALNNAFETFINSPIGNHEFADYLVVYIGEQIEQLRVQNKNTQQANYENIIRLFVFINQKQRFIKLYKIYLAQRLIRYQRQVDSKKNKNACQIELNVVEEMEKKCGTQDLESLRMMIKDYQKIENEVNKKIDLQGNSLAVQKPIIIYKQFWPEIDEVQINLPCELIKLQKEEIAAQHSQKTLIWLDLISSVEVCDKQFTFNISVPQAAILFLYQFENSPLDLQTISTRSNLHITYVIKNCEIMKESKILEELVKDNTKYYSYNESITKKKAGKQQKKITTDTYFQTTQIEQVVSVFDKDLAIEAAIVKLIKKNKQMQFSDLVIQVQGHMKTNQNIEISFAQIKLMIDKLERNEYLERDSNNMQLIKYK